jgi:hypothetical protein
MTVTAAQPREIATITVNEGNLALVSGTLVDEDGAPVALSTLLTLTLTLYNVATDAILNNRDAQSIKNANGGTVDTTSGAFTLLLNHLDNVLISTTLSQGQTETHVGLVEATWTGGGYWSGIIRVYVRAVHRNT